MTNPFAQFAAAAGSDGGWLTTKKKGVDDEQIERDRERALQLRKNARRQKYNSNHNKTTPPPPPKQPSTVKKASSKKRKSKSTNNNNNDDDDDDDDLDGFIVDDDDEEELDECDSDSDEEEEELVIVKKSNKRKTVARSRLSSDEDSDEKNSFLPDFARRTSRPAQKRPSLSNRFKEEKKNDSDDDDDDDNSSDVEVLGATKSCHFAKQKTTSVLDSSDDDDENDMSIVKLPGTRKRYAKSSNDDDDDDDDNKAWQYDSEDDQLALAMAISASTSQPQPSRSTKPQSRKRLQKKGKSKSKSKKRKKIQRVVVPLLSSQDSDETNPGNGVDVTEETPLLEESSSDDEQAEEQDAYEDADAKEAGMILKAANELSATVLQAMTAWVGSDKVPTGMIVDGALSMFQLAVNDMEERRAWISQETMQTIVPQVKLADYQLIGVNWLALLHGLTYNVNGKINGTNVNGVLADEMGLGKTVQTIAFLAWLRHENRQMNGIQEPKVVALDDDDSKDDDSNSNPVCNETTSDESYHVRPHIIVVPASVLSNWEREFNKFCPEMHVIKYHGSMAEREELKIEMQQYLPGKRGANAGPPLDVVLTTYSYFSSEKTDDRNFLRKFKFDYLVVDEAHCLKNPRGMRYRNMDKFETSHRLLLTGTPVQNSPKELMSLLCFLMPLFVGIKGGNGLDFDEDAKNDGGESMLQAFLSLESSNVSNEEDANVVAYRNLKQLFAPFVLRRRKIDVLSQIMPPKTRKVEFVPFDNATRAVYDSILATHIGKRENPSMCLDSAAQQHLFTALRKAANHPLLLRTRHTSDEAVSHLAKHLFRFGYFGRHETCTEKNVRQELERFSDFDIHCAALELLDENPLRRDELARYTLEEEDLFSSPKFVRLRSLLPELVAKGHRILIFSQWTRCMDLLGCLMESLQMKFLRLDGKTSIPERQNLIDEFNQDSSIPVFLLSTRAGGMGINLTAADVCVLHDLDFNPFNDIQAEDRCHRIGQTKPVQIFKLVTEGTVDADIYDMQQRKAKMNAAILENTQQKTKDKKEDDSADIGNILKSAMDRYLLSPQPKGKGDEVDNGNDAGDSEMVL